MSDQCFRNTLSYSRGRGVRYPTAARCMIWFYFLLQVVILKKSPSCCHAWASSSSFRSITSVDVSSIRRNFLHTPLVFIGSIAGIPNAILADDNSNEELDSVLSAPDTIQSPVEVSPLSSDAKKLFNEGRAFESQGNMAAAQRLYAKVTKISPRFIYGWSNLGNTQVAMGDLNDAEENYSKAISLCQESQSSSSDNVGRRCNDLYLLLLNRGSVRLNTFGMAKEALQDLQRANTIRQRPDAIVLQNLARAEELNGLYTSADRDYTVSISMTANEVNPFWLRAAMVKLQLGDVKGGQDLLKRVENRFPDAPEVKAASATFLARLGQQIEAQRKFLEIPDRQRLRYIDDEYLHKMIAWPPSMIDGVTKIAEAVGDVK